MSRIHLAPGIVLAQFKELKQERTTMRPGSGLMVEEEEVVVVVVDSIDGPHEACGYQKKLVS